MTDTVSKQLIEHVTEFVMPWALEKAIIEKFGVITSEKREDMKEIQRTATRV